VRQIGVVIFRDEIVDDIIEILPSKTSK
jgi:hypothetical protein